MNPELLELRSAAAHPNPPRLKAQLQPGWSQPEAFEAELLPSLTRAGIPLRGALGRRVDPYAELVGRHLDCPTPALVFPARGGGWREASFRELHAETARLVTLWRRVGVRAGHRIAVPARADPIGLVPLLTALRLGATAVCLTGPGGTPALERLRLEAARPDFSALPETAWDEVPTLPAQAHPGTIAEEGMGTAQFEADAPCLELWDAGFTPGEPVFVPARQLLVRLAADTLIAVQPQPGWRMAAPGVEPNRHFPVLPLLALFSRATWVSCDLATLIEHPLDLHWVGVDASTRDAVLDGTLPTRGWRRWWRDPSEPLDWATLQRLSALLAGQNVLGQNLHFSSGLGGSLLFGPPELAPALEVFPSPGLPYGLEEPGAPGQLTENPTGVLAGRDGLFGLGASGRSLVSAVGSSFVFAGSALPGRFATAFPVHDVVRVAKSHPSIEEAVVVVSPLPGVLNGTRVDLIGFVDPSRDPDPVADLLAAALFERLEHEIGPTARPDRALAFPLWPRRTETGEIDLEWCRFQLSTGGLRAKSRDPIFRLGAMLRRWADQAANGE